jgi:hypothetical protein
MDWKWEGISKYGCKKKDMDAIICRLARIGVNPKGYNYPELFRQPQLPNELQ